MVVLTEKQAEILNLYNVENLTQKQIAERQDMTQQNVSRILKKTYILQKGCIKKGVVKQSRTTKTIFWRYHALHFVITPYYFYPRYQKTREERGNQFIKYREWKINLHEKSIEMILRKGYDFPHKDKYESMRLGEESFNRTLFEISNKFGFQYEKEGRVSIKLVKQHLARTNSPLAKQQKGQFMQIKGIDGKVWFLIDRSKGLAEHEYTHSGRLLSDVDRVEAFLNDLRENQDLSMSGLDSRQRITEKAIYELTVQIKLHLEVQQETLKTLKKIGDSFK